MPRVSKYVADGLTTKMRKAAKGVARGKSKAQAYRDAGYSSRYPSQEMHKLLRKPEVLKAVNKEEERLERVMNSEIDNTRIVRKYSDLMEAEKDGQSDNTSQLKALDQIHKIRGDYAPEKSLHAHQHTLTEKMLADIEEGIVDA